MPHAWPQKMKKKKDKRKKEFENEWLWMSIFFQDRINRKSITILMFKEKSWNLGKILPNKYVMKMLMAYVYACAHHLLWLSFLSRIFGYLTRLKSGWEGIRYLPPWWACMKSFWMDKWIMLEGPKGLRWDRRVEGSESHVNRLSWRGLSPGNRVKASKSFETTSVHVSWETG